MQYLTGLVQGTVTSINHPLAYLVIDDKIIVQMGVRLAQDNSQMLPLLGSKILVEKAYGCGLNYVLCKCSRLEGVFTTFCPQNDFLDLIRLYDLNVAHLFKFEEVREVLQKNFTDVQEIKMDILLSLFQNIIHTVDKEEINHNKGNNCCGYPAPVFSLITVSTCKHVEIKSSKYLDFPYWSFGVHPSKKNVMLFGWLEIHPIYGFYMITDSHYKIVCIITESSTKTDVKLSQFADNYVLIKKYTVVTEVFSEECIPGIEYMVASADDIHIVHSVKKDIDTFENASNSYDVTSFVVLKKGTICVRVNNKFELLLQVFIRCYNMEVVWEEVYFVLPSTYVTMNFNFKEGSLYMLHHNTPLQEVSNLELARIKPLKIYEVPGKGCYIEPVYAGLYNLPEPLSIPGCKFHLQNKSDLVCFRGIVKEKRFINPLSSRTVKNSKVYGFGTPGFKNHQIVFSHLDENDTIYLDCYLNNWENKLMPLGLVPQMEVIVKHVYPQSKKYFKSSIFTTFEIVSYKPLTNFNTVNLYENEEINWGFPSYLSQGHKIPAGVLVWGQVYNIFMLKFSIAVICTHCKRVDCSEHTCEDRDREVEFTARFNAADQYGQSTIITRSFKVLQAFLNLNSTTFDKWIINLRCIGSYHYNYFDEKNVPVTSLHNYLRKYFEQINERRLVLDLKCRKLKATSNQRPLWFCVDARRH
ncbi:hypothetical protein NQ315_015557 [Exocentrus adspersus]|uniref:CST complex subunit CTC1 n=1 Tax=Exocentrus adspersus TaxID=1586481 RepID=A0AAV8V648_9CUCU|nr:hypothetical protein NQ315_015557 [Exocentrus adspersus]